MVHTAGLDITWKERSSAGQYEAGKDDGRDCSLAWPMRRQRRQSIVSQRDDARGQLPESQNMYLRGSDQHSLIARGRCNRCLSPRYLLFYADIADWISMRRAALPVQNVTSLRATAQAVVRRHTLSALLLGASGSTPAQKTHDANRVFAVPVRFTALLANSREGGQ